MKILGNEIKPGMVIEHKNDLWSVLKAQHVKPGKGGAFNQVELKSVKKESQPSDKNFSFNKNIFVDIKEFKYPNSKNFEISDVKINISKGQKIGIIGSTASGKSTVVEIVTGILEPTKGNIIVDGESIFSNRNGWQRLIGFVPQKILILDESLRNNILFGLNRTKYNDEKIISIIKKFLM